MAAISSPAVTALLRQSPPGRTSCLTSSSSVFFSSKINSGRVGVGLPVDRARGAKKGGLSCTCLFGLGVPELVVIVGVAALVFGPKQIPEVGRSIGKTVKSFQQAAREFEVELKKEGEASMEPSSDKEDEEKKQEAEVPSA
ncbi:uncharacterized protein LOC127260894 [Andrographis paniculata]|uniref:uncharacterized protein LOC127260894 n=1 Tax=Andrographis paniculata TaxID=175694 RepID=UPI0021E6DBCE|nr:uncharacterized protein LOC127260894 [Andrographis paniculata]